MKGTYLEGNPCGGVPFRMFLGKPFLSVGLDTQFLSLSQFHNHDVIGVVGAVVLSIVVLILRRNGNHSRITALQVSGCDISGLLVSTLDIKGKFDGTVGAKVGASAVS